MIAPRAPFRLIAAICLFAAIAAAALMVAQREGLASQSPRARSDILLRQAVVTEMDTQRLRRLAQDIARNDPLHAVGFFLEVMALDQEKRMLSPRHRALIAQASRRQPAFAAPRIWLTADNIRNKRYAEAIQSADAVMRLNSEFRQLLVPLLVPLLGEAKAQPLLDTQLRAFPIWRSEFLAEAIKVGGYEAQVENMLRHPIPKSGAATMAADRSAYLNKLVSDGEAGRAYALWRSFAVSTAKGGVFDGDFKASHPVQPFAWKFAADDYSYAERVPPTENSLALVRAHHGGDGKAVLLSQLVALKPGVQSLFFTMRDGGLAEPQKLFWRVRCLDSTEVLASRSLDRLAPDWQKLRLQVDIPASSCTLQRLTLEAEDNDNDAAEVELRLVEAG
jgi:hypothetical protein